MKELENLKDLYLEEVRRINKKGELTPADDEVAKKCLEGIKLIECICDREYDDGYSEKYSRSYSGSRSMMPEMRSSRNMDYSRDYDYNRNPKRYSYGYSRDAAAHEMIERLEDMRNEPMDERRRMVIDNAIADLRNMH